MSLPQRVLFILAGEQPMPGLIPILQHRPDVAIFLYSDHTASQVANVCAALELADGLDAIQCVQERIDPAHFIRSADVLSRVMARYPGSQFLFNLSGGTKLMALSMYRAAAGQGEVLYVSGDGESIFHLRPEAIVEEPIAVRVPAAVYLRAHGAAVDPARSLDGASLSPVHFQVARHLALWTLGLEGWRKALAGRKKVCPPASYPVRVSLPHPTPAEAAIVDLLARLGWVARVGKGASFVIESPDTLLFLNGGWLEVYALDVARGMGLFHDCRAHLGIVHPRLGQNELDLIAMRGAVATICSCKTGRPHKSADRLHLLDELEARASTLGAFCGKLLIASQPRQAYGCPFLRRAEQKGIEVAAGEDLPQLGEALARASRRKGKAGRET